MRGGGGGTVHTFLFPSATSLSQSRAAPKMNHPRKHAHQSSLYQMGDL